MKLSFYNKELITCINLLTEVSFLVLVSLRAELLNAYTRFRYFDRMSHLNIADFRLDFNQLLFVLVNQYSYLFVFI